MRKMVMRVGIGFYLLLIVFLLSAKSGWAAPTRQTSANGLSINGALINVQNAAPGQVFEHEMIIGIGSGSPAVDVSVEAFGFGQDYAGAFRPLPAEQDVTPYSARTWITQITPAEFRLEPGTSMPVKVTLTVPQDPGNGSHYALLFVDTDPGEQADQVGQILTASVPVIVTPATAQLDWSGEITDVSVKPVVSGEPIQIETTVKNSGNQHYRVQGLVSILAPSGQPVADIPIQNTHISIFPTFSQQIHTTYAALNQDGGLPPGSYTLLVSLAREDGAQLDSKKTTFEITEAFRPFPGIEPENLVIECFEDEVPDIIDAIEKTDVLVTFENMNRGTGCIAIGKYTQEPAGTPGFSSPIAEGGMGGKPIKYIGILVDGFNRGVAHVRVRYLPQELADVNANSLMLAYQDANAWRKLENLIVQTGAEAVLGDLQVAMLNQERNIAMGGDASVQTNPARLSPTWLASAGILLMAVIAGVFVWRSRHKHIKDN